MGALTCPSVRPSVHQSVPQSVHQSVRQSLLLYPLRIVATGVIHLHFVAVRVEMRCGMCSPGSIFNSSVDVPEMFQMLFEKQEPNIQQKTKLKFTKLFGGLASAKKKRYERIKLKSFFTARFSYFVAMCT